MQPFWQLRIFCPKLLLLLSPTKVSGKEMLSSEQCFYWHEAWWETIWLLAFHFNRLLWILYSGSRITISSCLSCRFITEISLLGKHQTTNRRQKSPRLLSKEPILSLISNLCMRYHAFHYSSHQGDNHALLMSCFIHMVSVHASSFC